MKVTLHARVKKLFAFLTAASLLASLAAVHVAAVDSHTAAAEPAILSQKKPAYANGVYGHLWEDERLSPRGAVDGRKNADGTYNTVYAWAPAGTNMWIYIDLQKVTTFNFIRLYNYINGNQSNGFLTLKLEAATEFEWGSVQGVDEYGKHVTEGPIPTGWTTIYEGTVKTGVYPESCWNTFTFDEPITARFVRLSSPQNCRIIEFQVMDIPEAEDLQIQKKPSAPDTLSVPQHSLPEEIKTYLADKYTLQATLADGTATMVSVQDVQAECDTFEPGEKTVTLKYGTGSVALPITVTPGSFHNLALNKTAAAGSVNLPEVGVYQASRATDGKMDTSWKVHPNAAAEDLWMCVDLGRETEVDRVRISYFTSSVSEIQLQYSNDEKNWAEAFRETVESAEPVVTAKPTDTLEKTWEEPIRARYIRINVKAGEGFHPAVREFELYNIPEEEKQQLL
mgnify:CR=1 FL=1